MMTVGGGRGLRSALGAALEERIALLAPARRQRFALVTELVERHAAGRPLRVLDAGCGDGLLTLALAQRHPGWRLLGADNRPELLDQARRRAARRGLENLEFEVAELTDPLPRVGFDVVLAIELLEEVHDDLRALRVLATALAPGGLLLVHVPERSWRPLLPGSPATWRDEVRHGYSPEQIAGALRSVGLESVEVTPTFRSTVALAQELRDRLRATRPAVRAAAFPLMAAAVALERRGLTWGPARALLAAGRRPGGAG
jgi:SAM-dependent methyltransferase